MHALVVVPFHDPRWLASTAANVRRQRVALQCLLVLNGAATDLEPVSGVSSIISEPGHASAVNAGVAWAVEHGYTHVVLFDSDDYYGPRYTEKVLATLERVDYCGQRALFTQFCDGAVHLMQRPTRSFVFATVGFSVAKFVPVQHILDNCDDWSQRMDARGCSKEDTGPSSYCYFRHGANAHWDGRISDVCVRLAWGPSEHFVGASHLVCDEPASHLSVPCPCPTPAEVLASL